MTIEQMRGEISLAYSGPAWAARVDRMSENQVCAVYHRLAATGKLDEVVSKKHEEDNQPVQLSFFDKEYNPS